MEGTLGSDQEKASVQMDSKKQGMKSWMGPP